MAEDATGTPGLQWYADSGPRRGRQLGLDAAVAVWVAAWVVLGVLVHRTISALASPALSVADGAADGANRLRDGGEDLAAVPLVGKQVGAPLRGAASALDSVAAASQETADLVATLALTIGVLLPLGPVVLVLALWLPVRLRFARRAGAARRLLAGGADPQLFALRALTTQPLPRLMTVSRDPVGDWRRGDPAVTLALAHLELDGLGVDARGRLARQSPGSRQPLDPRPPLSP